MCRAVAYYIYVADVPNLNRNANIVDVYAKWAGVLLV